MTVLVGALGASGVVEVDDAGVARPVGQSFAVGWWLGVGDGWRRPGHDPVRTGARGGAPVSETAMRVGDGDVVVRWYGVGGAPACVVVDVENTSTTPCTLALVVRPTGPHGFGAVSGDGARTVIGRGAVLVAPGAPRRFAIAPHADALHDVLASGRASDGPIVSGTAAGTDHVALLFPLPHRVRWRGALVLDRGAGLEVDPARLPSPDAAAAGWERALERGMRVDVADLALTEAVDLARATALLRAPLAGRSDDALAATLEDWGFDQEAVEVWHRLGFRARRRAARRGAPDDPWAVVQGTRHDPAGRALELLRAVRAVVVREPASGTVDGFPALPVDWLGVPLAVHDAPTRAGPCSFAVRWHGARPAVLWDIPAGTRLRAPALDPSWSTVAPRGEALLAPPPARLLSLRAAGAREGTPVEEPDSFA